MTGASIVSKRALQESMRRRNVAAAEIYASYPNSFGLLRRLVRLLAAAYAGRMRMSASSLGQRRATLPA